QAEDGIRDDLVTGVQTCALPILAEEERDRHKLDRKIVAEEHWLRYGVTARRKRNVRRLGALQALREQRVSYRATAGSAALDAAADRKSVVQGKGGGGGGGGGEGR